LAPSVTVPNSVFVPTSAVAPLENVKMLLLVDKVSATVPSEEFCQVISPVVPLRLGVIVIPVETELMNTWLPNAYALTPGNAPSITSAAFTASSRDVVAADKMAVWLPNMYAPPTSKLVQGKFVPFTQR